MMKSLPGTQRVSWQAGAFMGASYAHHPHFGMYFAPMAWASAASFLPSRPRAVACLIQSASTLAVCFFLLTSAFCLGRGYGCKA